MAIKIRSPSLETPPYVELHCHSAYSFLDGVSLPDELAHSAAELGHVALALTDHNSVSGSMELAQVAKDAGVRAIHGAEVDVTLVALAERRKLMVVARRAIANRIVLGKARPSDPPIKS